MKRNRSQVEIIDLVGNDDDVPEIKKIKLEKKPFEVDEADANALEVKFTALKARNKKSIATMKQKFKERNAAMKQRLEKAEADAKDLELKASVVKLENAAVKRQCQETELENEKKIATMEQKVKAVEAENEKKNATMEQRVKAVEAENQKDVKYAEMKKQLSDAMFDNEIDEKVIFKAYKQIGQLERDLESAKLGKADDKDPSKADDKDPSKGKSRLLGCSSELISKIESGIIDNSVVTMDSIAGLEFVKKCINELVVWPMSRPDIFTGLRALPRGLLLFGPPGTGKTMILARQLRIFFYISASSIGSKWAGESEQLVRTLFAVASAKQPSVIFIDEIDSMLTKRSDDESAYRRGIKTEFMVQLDGMSDSNDSVLVIGATNCPHTLDKAIRRRFVKRIYIPMPPTKTRIEFMNRALRDCNNDLAPDDFKRVAESTEGFSCADMMALCTEAALAPVRAITDIRNVKVDDIRAIQHQDFQQALESVKASVGVKSLKLLEDWNAEFGSLAYC